MLEMAGLDVAVVDDREPSLADGNLEAEVIPLAAVDVPLPFRPQVVDAALLADLRHLGNECNSTIQYNTIQYSTVQYNTIQYNTIQYLSLIHI